MITQLSIRGLAIIEELHIDFSPRLNVITGETGAGKSILIKALHLILGAKADADVIRNGFEKAFVSASFLLPKSHPAIAFLDENGLWHDEHDLSQLILRREISTKNRSQAWINDQAVTLSTLRDLAQHLIDIYGQHENHRMLDPSTHLEYIDQFLKKPQIRQQLVQIMGQVATLHQDIRKQLEQFLERRREQDYLQFRFNELEDFQPSHEDFEKTIQVCNEAKNFVAEQKTLSHIQSICDEGFQGKSLSSAIRELQRLNDGSALMKRDASMQATLQQLREMAPLFDELSYSLGRLSGNEEMSEETVEAYEGRLAGYQSLFRKLGLRSVEDLVAEYERLEREISYVKLAPDELADKIKGLLKLALEADQLARGVSDARKAAAGEAKKIIERELHDLNMAGARIEFDFQPVRQVLPDLDLSDFSEDTKKSWSRCVDILSETNKFGRERGQFLLAANPGEGFKPLAKVASGGEISRIMLGFKKALAAGANTCVMVFDEIDTGISGQTAHIVGRKLKELSDQFQVICISHLAQVAAYGDAHFRVQKSQKKGSTESHILRLDPEESANEIARLLSGMKVTASSLQNAKQLIEAARS